MAAAEAHRASAAAVTGEKRTTNTVLAVRFFYVENCRFFLAAAALRFRHLRIFQNDGMEEKYREKDEEKFFEEFFKKLAKTAYLKRSI